ncbi:hypothetical protein [Brasilonema sennae]|nr:hypothetical protein [Brasilonema sennae]
MNTFDLPLRGLPVAHGGNQRQVPTEGNPPAGLAPQDRAGSPKH